MGCRHHLRPDVGRFPVPCGGPGCLEPQDRRMGAAQVAARGAEGWYNPHRRHSALGSCRPPSSRASTTGPRRRDGHRMPRRPRRAQLLALTLPMFESPILSTEPGQVLHGRRRRIAGPDDRAVGASREVLALTSAAGYSRRRMGTDTSQHSCRLALAQQARQARSPLALTRPIGYPRRRMGTSARHPSRRLAVARRAMRLPRSAAEALATSLALVYDRACLGNDMTQPSRRLARTHPTRLPDYRAPIAAQSTTQRPTARFRC